MFSSLRSVLHPSLKSYRFSRTPARVTLVVAGAAAALLAIAVVALGLSLGGAPPARPAGHSRTALAATSGAASGVASGAAASHAASRAAVAGSGTRRGAPAPRHSSAATPSSAQATAHQGRQHQAAPQGRQHQAAPQGGQHQAAPQGRQHQAAPQGGQHQAAPQGRQHQAAPQAQAKATQPQPEPYLIYDSVNPQAIPGDPVIATYADGPNPDPPSAVANFSHVLWIDIDASDPQANALDIEPGCATPSEAAGWVSARLNADPHTVAILYTMISQWSTVQADVSSLPAWMQSRIRWWIADPTGSPHIVPGSQATQWYWGQNYDISTALPGF